MFALPENRTIWKWALGCEDFNTPLKNALKIGMHTKVAVNYFAVTTLQSCTSSFSHSVSACASFSSSQKSQLLALQVYYSTSGVSCGPVCTYSFQNVAACKWIY